MPTAKVNFTHTEWDGCRLNTTEAEGAQVNIVIRGVVTEKTSTGNERDNFTIHPVKACITQP